MKRFPECRRYYYDDTLLYCLEDGSALLERPESGPTAGDEPASITTSTSFSHNAAAEPIPRR